MLLPPPPLSTQKPGWRFHRLWIGVDDPLVSVLDPGLRDYYNYFCVKPERSGVLRVIIMAMTRVRTHSATDGPTPAAVVHTAADLAGLLLAFCSSAVSSKNGMERTHHGKCCCRAQFHQLSPLTIKEARETPPGNSPLGRKEAPRKSG